MINNSDGWMCLQSKNMEYVSNISLANRGLAYGDGFFTTMGVMDGIILWQEYHCQRIDSHATALQLDMDSDRLLKILKVHAEQLQQGMLKLIVTRAPQSVRGYGFTPTEFGSACEMWLKATAIKIATSDHWQLPDSRTVPMQPAISAVCLTSQLAGLPPSLIGLKSLNRLDNVLASGELQGIKQTQPNIDIDLGEGLVRDMTGCWVEGTMSNVFYQLNYQINSRKQTFDTSDQFDDTQWYTPPLDRSGVRGVMRTVIMDAYASAGMPIIERALRDEDLPHLSQLFFCNALRGVMPVSSLALLSGDVINFA